MKLYHKFAIAMLMLFITLGGVLIYVSAKTSEMYSLEVTQKINRNIALHAAEDMPLLLSNGQANKKALKELAHHVMFINPIVEVYLLDPQGNVLSHALPAGSVLKNQVNMAPLHNFLAGSQTMPIFGDDPRSHNQQKVFSASPILQNGKVAAYLYTVLNGKKHDSLRESLQNSYNLQIGSAIIIASILLAVIAGLIIFLLFTTRLKNLLEAVRVYRMKSFQEPLLLPKNTSMHDEVGELHCAISDMSKRIESQFAALQKVDHTRRELIANVSHDLRTPLASMQGYLETILIKDLQLSDAEKKQYLHTAYKHSKRLNQLITELFELAKLESSDIEPNWESFRLMELIQDLTQDYQLQAQEKQIDLQAQCEDMDITVYADIALIHRVLENLLKNALAHTNSGGEITLRVHQEQEKVWLEVIDNGVGIAAHEIPYIFERFYRPSTEEPQTGNGLGLAIVKRIIELHRSQVAVNSQPGQWTTFSFWLPQTVMS
ncbi:MAG: signal transduction histidine kinase [Pseudohongiellaceae bacterium]|jgi:signal transduction histidine kinase